jgi:hypothetical protein
MRDELRTHDQTTQAADKKVFRSNFTKNRIM